MAGRKIERLRQMVTDAALKCADAKGTEDETFARNRLEALKAELADEEARRGKFGKKPGAPSVWNKTPGPKTQRKAKADGKRKAAARLVGSAALGHHKADDLANAAGVLAAEIAVSGVRKDFALLKPGAPEPLTDAEFANARDIVATVASQSPDGALMITGGPMTRDRWLAETFPALTEDRRVKCARFLSGMATLAAEKPGEKAADGATVIEKALEQAGMTYVEFENARQADGRFDGAQAAIKAARKRCIMDRLEETLQNRALFGQDEETCDRFGQTHSVRRIDNNLAFNLLKYGHEMYLRQNIRDKAKVEAMTLMIAQGAYPEVPRAREPKQAEVIDVK